jgi:hypothetical protein
VFASNQALSLLGKYVRLILRNLHAQENASKLRAEIGVFPQVCIVRQGAIPLMEYLEKVLDTLKNFARKVIEALIGSESEPALEPIPIPVRDRRI